MRVSDIVISKFFICLFEPGAEVVPYSEHVLGTEDELYRYVCQLMNRYIGLPTGRKARIPEDSRLLSVLPQEAEQMEPFVNYVCEQVQDQMRSCPDIPGGTGIFVWAVIEDQPWIAFFKCANQARFCLKRGEKESVSWFRNSLILPGPSAKAEEYFYLNLPDLKARVSDREFVVNGEKKNYLAESVLDLSFGVSETKVLKMIDETVVDTICSQYPEEAPQKIMDYRMTLADQVQETGEVTMEEITEMVFEEDEEAARICLETAREREVPEKAVTVSKKSERQLTKKQRLVTDSGIELLIPMDILREGRTFSCSREEDGTMSIVIREISSLENK